MLETPEEKGIKSISVPHGRVISLSSQDAESVINISTKMLGFVTKKLTKKNQEFCLLFGRVILKKFYN